MYASIHLHLSIYRSIHAYIHRSIHLNINVSPCCIYIIKNVKYRNVHDAAGDKIRLNLKHCNTCNTKHVGFTTQRKYSTRSLQHVTCKLIEASQKHLELLRTTNNHWNLHPKSNIGASSLFCWILYLDSYTIRPQDTSLPLELPLPTSSPSLPSWVSSQAKPRLPRESHGQFGVEKHS